MFRRVLLIAASVGTLGACNAIFGVSDLEVGDPSLGGGGSGADLGGFGGSGGIAEGGSATGGDASGGDGGDAAGGAGGQGGAPPPTLEDRGLLVRYFVDEAASGLMPGALVDSGPAPAFDLALTYDGMQYVSPPTGNGIEFTGVHNGKAEALITPGTKVFDVLNGATQATMEVVFDADPSSNSDSDFLLYLKRLGTADGRFGIAIRDDKLFFEFNQETQDAADASQQWDVDVRTPNRVIAHVVVDTTLADAADRVVLFVDGVQAPVDPTPGLTITLPAQDEGVVICDGCYLLAGNSNSFMRPLEGTLYYGAIYTAAFTPAEIQNNVEVLSASDDTP